MGLKRLMGRKAVAFIAMAFALVSAIGVSTAAWFVGVNDIPMAGTKGSSAGTWFHGGHGTADDPYTLTDPVHVRNLAWLQYIGYFNLDEDEDGVIDKQFYFRLENDIDMTTWNATHGALPPIGTGKYPFLGNFNGQGFTITGAQVANKVGSTLGTTITEIPPGVQAKMESDNEDDLYNVRIVGFFGIVGESNGKGVDTGHTYSDLDFTDNIVGVNNLYLDNCTVTSTTSTSLGGIGVGYMNAGITGLGISDSSLSFANGTTAITSVTNNLSDYATVGYATDTYVTNVGIDTASLVAPTVGSEHGVGSEGGANQGWGGSVDMESMYNRLYDIRQNRSTEFYRGHYSATYNITITQSTVGGVTQTYTSGADTPASTTEYDTSYRNLYAYNRSHIKSGYTYDPLQGEFAYALQQSSSGSLTYNTNYMYMFGGNKTYPEFQMTSTRHTTSGGTGYEQKSTIQVAVSKTTTVTFPTYSIYGGYNTNVYANISNGALSAGNSATTYWAFENSSTGQPVAATSASNAYIFTIVNGTTYYLYGESTSSCSITTSKSSATLWTYSTYNNNGRLQTSINGTSTYLDYYQSTWQFYSSAGSASSWTITASGNSINADVTSTEEAYVNASTTAISAGNSANSATRWVFSQRSQDSGAIYTTINSATYYLVVSGNALAVSTAASNTWTYANNRLTTVVDNTTYYVTYGSSGGFTVTSDSSLAGTATKTDYDEELYENITYTTYTLSAPYNSRTYYLNATTSAVSAATTASTYWCFEGGKGSSGHMFFISNSTKYYIYCNGNNSFGITTSLSTVGNNGTFTIPSGSSGNIQVNYNGTAHYLYVYSNNAWRHATNPNSGQSTITITEHGSETILGRREGTTTDTTTTENNGTAFPETYFPLSVNDDYTASDTNSGYVVSGSNGTSSSALSTQNYNDGFGGDIRVSKYAIGTIYNGLGYDSNSNVSYADNKLAVITKSYLSGGSYKRITDANYDTGSNGSSTLKSTVTGTQSYQSLGLEKYADSRGITSTDAGISKLLTGKSNIYGLHFVNAQIGMDNLVTAEKAKVSLPGQEVHTYDNYQLPRDSIDFSLKMNGFINFFAVTNFPATNASNDSFFTLHEIERDPVSHDITAINEISAIYAKMKNNRIDHSQDYVYVYTNGSNSLGGSGAPSGYTMVFDLTWISYSTGLANAWVNYAMYYFEVPVNAGEFALGSVSGHQGAYLIYLDLAANAMEYDFTNFTEYLKVTEYSSKYPTGVAIVQNSGSGESLVKDTVDPINGVALSITSAETVSFEKSGSTITVTYDAAKTDVDYVGVDIIMKKAGSDPPITPDGALVKTTEYFRLTSVAYNITMNRYEVTEVTKTVVTVPGQAATTTYSGRTSIDNGANWTAMNQEAANTAGATIGDAHANSEILSFAAVFAAVMANNAMTSPDISWLITYQDVADADYKFQEMTGYAFTLTNPSTSETMTITILSVETDQQGNLTYTYTINTNGVTGAAQKITVAAASGS